MPEKFESPESKLPKYENLSETQKELLMSQWGMDAETYEAIINGEAGDAGPDWSPEEMIRNIKEAFEQQQ